MGRLDEIRTEYGGECLDALEQKALRAQSNSESYRREFIEILYYIREEKRFRDDKLFMDSSFDSYIRAKFMMTEAQFNRERIAYINFPEATKKFGPGIVAKAVGKLGYIGAGKVFKKMGKAKTVEAVKVAVESAADRKPKNTEKIEPVRDDMVDILREKERIIAEQESQINKLKRTVIQLKSELAQKEIELQRYRSMLGVGTEAVYTQNEIMA